MDTTALTNLASTLAKLGAPILGGALGGPVGAALAGSIVGALAEAFGVEATPEAVGKAVNQPMSDAVVAQVEAAIGPTVQSAEAAILADRQNARATTVALVEKGSPIAWGAPIVSVIVMLGFALLSYLSIYAPSAQREVLLFLLGNWSGMAGVVVAFWLGSSAGSAKKDTILAGLANGGRK